jgi:hypothetical protein
LDHCVVAKFLLSLLCGIQGLATLLIDLNRTHATNPLWARHARFHVVWQTVDIALLSVVELVLVWVHGPYERQSFYLALILTGISPLAFLAALAGRKLFGGALSDPNGIAPARLTLFGKVMFVDLNLAAVVGALITLAVIFKIYRW